MSHAGTTENGDWRNGLGADRTGEYRRLVKQATSDVLEALGAQLRGFTLVLVPGFLSDTMRDTVYFAEHRRRLSVLAAVKMPTFDSEDSPTKNGEIIGEEIDGYGRRGQRDIVLLTHSKGSLDTLYALTKRPALRTRIAGWVSLQGAILGSPVATCVADNPILGAKVRRLLDALFDGEPESIESLRKVDAERFVGEELKSGRLATLAHDIRTLFYGSSASYSLLLEPCRRAMADNQLPNDGLMPLRNTFLPGAPYVAEEDGPDHAAAVMPGWPIGFDEVKLAGVLLSMCLSAAQPS
jgi:hypothetical protein